MVDLRLGRILTRECKAIQLLTDMLCHSIFRYVYVQCFFFWHLNKLASGLYLGGCPVTASAVTYATLRVFMVFLSASRQMLG